MARGRHKSASPEEKVAKRIGKEMADFTLDLEAIGFYLSRVLPLILFTRLMEVLESAEHNKAGNEYNVQWREYNDKDSV
jgi:hypothetical protein